MTNPSVSIESINANQFLNTGNMIKADEKAEGSEKFYIIRNFNFEDVKPNLSNIPAVDIDHIIEKYSGQKYDRKTPVILCLSGATTKIEKIVISGSSGDLQNSYGGPEVFLKVEGDFYLPTKTKGQFLMCTEYMDEALYGTRLVGGSEAQTLVGSEHPNQLFGAGGDDRLIGGLGDDNLRGGLGNDTYVFDSQEWGHDLIQDTEGHNIIDFGITSFPDKFIVEKREYLFGKETLVIDKDINNRIEIDCFFSLQDKFSFAAGEKKYILSPQGKDVYKFVLANK